MTYVEQMLGQIEEHDVLCCPIRNCWICAWSKMVEEQT